MELFELEIVTPLRTHAARSVASVDVPAETGRLTVLARHQAQACTLVAGAMWVRTEAGAEEQWTLGPGFLLVEKNRALVVVERAVAAGG